MTYDYFDSFAKVVRSVSTQLARLFTNFYENPRFNFLFNMALLPLVMLFAFDIIMSFILSFRVKKLIIFNVLSARSWSVISSGHIQNRLKPDAVSVKRTGTNRVVGSLVTNRSVNKVPMNTNNSKVYDGGLRHIGFTRLGLRAHLKLKQRGLTYSSNAFRKALLSGLLQLLRKNGK